MQLQCYWIVTDCVNNCLVSVIYSLLPAVDIRNTFKAQISAYNATDQTVSWLVTGQSVVAAARVLARNQVKQNKHHDQRYESSTRSNIINNHKSHPNVMLPSNEKYVVAYALGVKHKDSKLQEYYDIGILPRKCHRLITLNNATSITHVFSCNDSLQAELYVGQN